MTALKEVPKYIEMCTKDAEVLVIELSEYDKDLIALSEQCRKAELTAYQLFLQIDTIANKHLIHARRVIADLFAC